MRRAIILALGTSLCAFGIANATAEPQEQSAAKPPSSKSATSWTSPKNAFGQPDLTGSWNNATLTPLTRDRKLGDKPALTAVEARSKEAAFAEGLAQRDAQVTDPNSLPGNAEDKAKDAKLIATRADFGPAGGAVGGYNTYWLDPGNHFVEVNGEFRTSILTTTDGQAPARRAGAPKPAGGAQFRDVYDNYEDRVLGERCIIGFGRNAGPPMLPNGYYNNNYQIVQTADSVVIDVEMIHDVRIVRLNAKHRADDVRPWMGDAIGRYDGDTLVVETTNIPEAQNFMGSWKKLKVTEYFTRISDTKILYRFQIEDPDFWEKPWGGEYTFQVLNGQLYEYACHEGNYALPGILGGARNLERKASEAKSTTASGQQRPR